MLEFFYKVGSFCVGAIIVLAFTALCLAWTISPPVMIAGVAIGGACLIGMMVLLAIDCKRRVVSCKCNNLEKFNFKKEQFARLFFKCTSLAGAFSLLSLGVITATPLLAAIGFFLLAGGIFIGYLRSYYKDYKYQQARKGKVPYGVASNISALFVATAVLGFSLAGLYLTVSSLAIFPLFIAISTAMGLTVLKTSIFNNGTDKSANINYPLRTATYSSAVDKEEYKKFIGNVKKDHNDKMQAVVTMRRCC